MAVIGSQQYQSLSQVLLGIVLLLSSAVFGQSEFVIKDVKLFDGEQLIEKTSVHVKDGRIYKIGTNLATNVPQIAGQGKMLLPAFTNAHVHVFSMLGLMQAAKAGVMNLFDMHGVEMAQSGLKRYNDSTLFATLYSAGAAATAPEGHGTQFGFPSPTLTKPEEANAFVTERIQAGADYIKIIVEPWKATLDRPTITALIQASHKQGRKAVVHISTLDDATFVLGEHADGLVHLWWDQKLSEATLRTLAQEEEFFVIPTLLTSIRALKNIRAANPTASYLTDDELLVEVKKLYDAGIPILVGTDPPNVGINYGDDLYEEMALLVRAGIPMLEVLKSATSVPMVQFGIAQKGMIKVGYSADMILVDGDVTKDLNVLKKSKQLFKAGKSL